MINSTEINKLFGYLKNISIHKFTFRVNIFKTSQGQIIE